MANYPTGNFQNEVLRALLVKNGASHVTEISRYLELKLERDLLVPQTQVALKRLEQRGFVAILRQEKSDKGGPPKKIYGLTEVGRQTIGEFKSETADATDRAEGEPQLS